MTIPAQRRYRAYGLVILLVVLITLYIARSGHDTRNSEMYTRTLRSLDDRAAKVRATRNEKLNAGREKAAQKGKKTEDRDPKFPKVDTQPKLATPDQDPLVDRLHKAIEDTRVEGEKSVAGRKKFKDNSEKPTKDKDEGVSKVGNGDKDEDEKDKAETELEHKIEQELNTILRKSPIIVFSKTTCPHSKKAKHILLEKYKIIPPPYVVELDQHEMGSVLQKKLGELTGIKTVPNTLINARSIGGGDEVAAMDAKGTLGETVKSMAGKRVTEARLRSS